VHWHEAVTFPCSVGCLLRKIVSDKTCNKNVHTQNAVKLDVLEIYIFVVADGNTVCSTPLRGGICDHTDTVHIDSDMTHGAKRSTFFCVLCTRRVSTVGVEHCVLCVARNAFDRPA
jgi:hypothetical protein